MNFYFHQCKAPVAVDDFLREIVSRRGVLCDSCMAAACRPIFANRKPKTKILNPCRLPYADN